MSRRAPRTPPVPRGWHLATSDRAPFNWRVVRPDGTALRRTFTSISLALAARDKACSQLALFGAAS